MGINNRADEPISTVDSSKHLHYFRAVFRPTLLLVFLVNSQLLALDIAVTGVVRTPDARPLGGVNVILKGTSRGTATDMNGKYELLVPEGPAVLIFIFHKQRSVEQSLDAQPGFQYQVNVVMANTSQTFHKSVTAMGVLALSAPVIQGIVVNPDNTPLPGVRISQNNSAFETVTDSEGRFALPLAGGKDIVTFSQPGSKELEFEILSAPRSTQVVEVLLVNRSGRHRNLQSSAKLVHHQQ